jgi:hypothetical protein
MSREQKRWAEQWQHNRGFLLSDWNPGPFKLEVGSPRKHVLSDSLPPYRNCLWHESHDCLILPNATPAAS